MSGDLKQFLEEQRRDILNEKKRLDLLERLINDENKENQIANKPSNKKKSGECEKPTGKENVDDNKNEELPLAKRENVVKEAPAGVLNKGFEDESGNTKVENVPSLVEPLDFTQCYELTPEERKQSLIDKLTTLESPYLYRTSDETAALGVLGSGGAPFALPCLRRGEFAPPHYARLRAAPHEGLGEYEIGREFFGYGKRTRDCFSRPARNNHSGIKEALTDSGVEVKSQNSPPNSASTTRSTNTELLSIDTRSVQTDIQNINNELVVRYESEPPIGGELPLSLSPRRTLTDEFVDAALRRRSPYRPQIFDQRLTSAQNELLLRAQATMDKPKSILSNRRTGSPRDRYGAEIGHSSSYAPPTFLDGFTYSDRSDDLERERLKREAYQHDLRLQIEEKRQLAALRDEHERRERELENRRLEQQLLRMREEQVQQDHRRQRRNELVRRHSDDLLRRRTELHELQRPWRRHADSESANLDSLGLVGANGGYSSPIGRRAVSSYTSASYNVPATSVFSDSSYNSRYNASNRFDASSYPGGILRKTEISPSRRYESINSYDTIPLPRSHRSKFDRFDSLSRIDSLGHRLETMSMKDGYTSDLTDVQRRHSATQQDLSLSRSPRSRRRNSSSRFEDPLPLPTLKARSPVAKELRNAVPFSSRWQSGGGTTGAALESPVSSRGSILTQLGSIRAQLQREQLRMDESMRRRDLSRTRTIDDY